VFFAIGSDLDIGTLEDDPTFFLSHEVYHHRKNRLHIPLLWCQFPWRFVTVRKIKGMMAIAYKSPAIGSPWVIPSVEEISVPPPTNKREGEL